ncbi:MAG: AI-2E family transporter [Anaerolineae bacterium]|nr:AI-2E family transporter [Anaerolineae bacterium]
MNNQNWSQPARYITFGIMFLLVAIVGWYIQELYQPLIIAGLIAYILTPTVNLLKTRLRMRHIFSVILVYTVSLALFIAIPTTLVPILLSDINSLATDMLAIVPQIQVFLSEPFLIGTFEINPALYLPDVLNSIKAVLASLPENALHLIEATSRNILWFLVIVVTIFYLLLDWNKVVDWILRQVPNSYRPDGEKIYLAINRVWAAYLRGTLALMFIVAVVFSIMWLLIGLPGALVIGIVMGLLSIIPELGPNIGAALAVTVAALEGSLYLPLSNFWFAMLVFGIYVILINVKNVWLRPRIMGRSVHLHEGVVFVAIIAAILFQGILGALIIVPVLASLIVIGRYLRHRIYGEPPFPSNESHWNVSEEKKSTDILKEKSKKNKKDRRRFKKR